MSAAAFLVAICYGRTALSSRLRFYEDWKVSWHMIWQVRQFLASGCRSAVILICATSVSSPHRDAKQIFDVNDFDETLLGPLGMGCEATGCQHRGGGATIRLQYRGELAEHPSE